MSIRFLLFFNLFLFGFSAQANYGSISFTEEEKQRHLDGLSTITQTAADCLDADLKHHWNFYKQWGVSPFYGDRSSFAKNRSIRRSYLRQNTRLSESQITTYLKVMQPTSCVGLALKCMGKGFEAAGQADIWKKLKSFTIRNDVSGGALQAGLQQLGWRLLYWNPDVRKNYTWDNYERNSKPTNPLNIWGYHASHWSLVKSSRKYLYNRVDDISSLVNFGDRVPHAIKDVPFFVGTAHGGYHVFPGSFGQIIEGHSTRPLTDRQTIETSPFNPLVQEGGPRGEFRSGVIAVPPGYVTTPVSNQFPSDYKPGRMDRGHTAPMRPIYREPRRNNGGGGGFGFPFWW